MVGSRPRDGARRGPRRGSTAAPSDDAPPPRPSGTPAPSRPAGPDDEVRLARHGQPGMTIEHPAHERGARSRTADDEERSGRPTVGVGLRCRRAADAIDGDVTVAPRSGRSWSRRRCRTRHEAATRSGTGRTSPRSSTSAPSRSSGCDPMSPSLRPEGASRSGEARRDRSITDPAGDASLGWLKDPAAVPWDRYYSGTAADEIREVLGTFEPDVVVMEHYLYRYVDVVRSRAQRWWSTAIRSRPLQPRAGRDRREPRCPAHSIPTGGPGQGRGG